MAHRGITTLACALMVCFLLLTHFDPEFFLLHFYEALIYLILVLMIFYFHERWAYMLGILVPAGWLLITYGTGQLGGAMRQVRRVLLAHRPNDQVTFLAAIIAALSIVMIALCAYRWRRQYAGSHKGWATFLGALVITIVYYGILVGWYLQILAQESKAFHVTS